MENKNTHNKRLLEERNERLKKIELMKSHGISPYADRYQRSHDLKEAKELTVGDSVSVAGRITLSRNMGKLGFCQIIDHSGILQLVFDVSEISTEKYDIFFKIISIGDFIGVKGDIFITKKGEISVLVKEYTFLSKSLRPLPEKWHGLADTEIKYRKRYLDMISDRETFERFKYKSNFVSELRKFYEKNNFYEIETPVLSMSASGALAKPFKTHYNALNLDVYLRIAPEIYLKEAIVGGFDKIFEVARVFRNEGMDPSHLQEFTMVEHYCAYWNFEDNMKFTEEMIETLVSNLNGSLKIKAYNREDKLIEVDLSTPWKKISFRELLIKDCGIDIDKYKDVEGLRKAIKEKGIVIEDAQKLGRGNLIDSLYKKVSRPKLITPTFLINHPIDLSPLARKNDENPLITDRFQLIINGWEIVNAYSELIDPIDQMERFEEQAKAKEKGDEEAMDKDDDYIEAMEHGMPPISGWGMGVERIVALLTQQKNLRDVVMFPLLKPKDNSN